MPPEMPLAEGSRSAPAAPPCPQSPGLGAAGDTPALRSVEGVSSSTSLGCVWDIPASVDWRKTQGGGAGVTKGFPSVPWPRTGALMGAPLKKHPARLPLPAPRSAAFQSLLPLRRCLVCLGRILRVHGPSSALSLPTEQPRRSLTSCTAPVSATDVAQPGHHPGPLQRRQLRARGHEGPTRAALPRQRWAGKAAEPFARKRCPAVPAVLLGSAGAHPRPALVWAPPASAGSCQPPPAPVL